MRISLSFALLGLLLPACADDTSAVADGTGDSGSSSGAASMTTSSQSTTAPTGMTAGTGNADTGGTAADPSTGAVPDGTTAGDGPATDTGIATGSSGDDATTTGVGTGSDSGSSGGGGTSTGGMATGSSSDGGMATGSSSDGGMVTGSSSDGGMATGSSSDGGMVTGSSSDGGMESGSTGGDECVEIACGGQVYECGDCDDNDADGTMDGFDVECISPCDDDEDTFATGIPGDNIDLCNQDCFFDGNSGQGDDGCSWELACDPLDPDMGECGEPPANCPEQTQECVDNCQVPNGCDCFGCCTVTIDGTPINILIGSDECSLDNLAACPICMQVESCTDPCDPTDCELCFGEDELPPGCVEPTCPGEQQPCEVHTDCPMNFFCQTGCCELIPV